MHDPAALTSKLRSIASEIDRLTQSLSLVRGEVLSVLVPDIPSRILRLVSEQTGFSEAALIGRGRTADVALARQVAMVLIREVCGLKLTEVGSLFGRDRGTVIHAESAVADACATRPQVAAHFARVRDAALKFRVA